MVEHEVVWVRPESITYRIKYADNEQFCKSYDPQDYLRKNPSQLTVSRLTSDSLFSRKGSSSRDIQLVLFQRESGLLRTFSEISAELPPTIVIPQYHSGDSSSLKIYMEYLPYPTYHQKFMETNHEIMHLQLTAELVQRLTDFHNFCNAHLDSISSRVGRDSLKPRTLEEEARRTRSHLFTIIYHHSAPVADFCRTKGIDSTTPLRPETRSEIEEFLLVKLGVDLEKNANGIINFDFHINPKKPTFVHGDFTPPNVFYIPSNGTATLRIGVCDFAATRLGNPNVDLVSTLYNTHLYPFKADREPWLNDQAREYYHKTGNRKGALRNRCLGLVSSRLKDNLLRYFSITSQLSPLEIKLFFGKEFSSAEQREDFLKTMFKESLSGFFDYYHPDGGKGWQEMVEPSHSKRKKNSLRRLLRLAADTLRKTEVIPRAGNFGTSLPSAN